MAFLTKRRAKALGTGLLVSLPILPALFVYWKTNHLGFASYGFSKILMAALLLFLWWTFPARIRVKWRLHWPLPVLGSLSAWSFAGGFSVFAVYFGLLAFGFLWSFPVGPAGRLKQPVSRIRSGRSSILFSRNVRGLASFACIAVLWAVILLPLVQVDIVRLLRAASVAVVDLILPLLGVDATRTGITYEIVLGGQGGQVAILERCSGASTARVLFVVFGFLFLRRAQVLGFLFLTPLLALAAGLLTNSVRISLHLALCQALGRVLGEEVHEALGLAVLLVMVGPILFWQFRHPAAPAMLRLWRRRPGMPTWKQPGRALVMAVSVLLAVNLLLLPGNWSAKRIETQFSEGLAPSSARSMAPVWASSNEFIEHPGGGGWVVLEHPLEYCFAVRGLDADGLRIAANQQSRELFVRSRYKVGDRTLGRGAAMLRLWADPRLWRQPLRAEVRVEQTMDLGSLTSLP